MKITDISQYKGRTLRIDFEVEEPIFINSDIVCEYHLEKGMELPESAVSDIIRSNDVRRAKERALYLLDVRDYSYVELFKKLETNYERGVCFEVMNCLAELGCIDDRRYARNRAEHYMTVKKFGYYRAREEMRKKGLGQELIEEALEPYRESASERIFQLIDKKYAKYLIDEKGIEKVKSALVRLGYSYSQINSAIDEYLSEAHTDEE